MKQSFCFSPRPWSTWSQFAIHNFPKMLLLQFTPSLQNHHCVPTIRFKCAGLVFQALPDLAPVCLSHYRAVSNPTLHPAPQVYLLPLCFLSSILLLQPFHEIHPTLAQSLSRVRIFATTWTVAYQAPLSMGFSRQEYWSVLPFPSPHPALLLLLLSRFSRVPTLCDPTDGSPPGSAIPGILQARTLEWVAISFSNA